VYVEVLESALTVDEAEIRIARSSEIEDRILDYIQKEPSNLNAWGQTNSIEVFKMRLINMTEDDVRSKNGYSTVKQLRFDVSVLITPQLL
jgi:predicted oxidoreductase